MSKILSVNTRYYPDECNPMEPQTPTVAVLVQGDIGDYACYVGHGSSEWVARFGNKISFGEACCHFPNQLKKELYREQ